MIGSDQLWSDSPHLRLRGGQSNRGMCRILKMFDGGRGLALGQYLNINKKIKIKIKKNSRTKNIPRVPWQEPPVFSGKYAATGFLANSSSETKFSANNTAAAHLDDDAISPERSSIIDLNFLFLGRQNKTSTSPSLTLKTSIVHTPKMATLSNLLPSTSNATAVIVPGPSPLSISFTQLNNEIRSFQAKLAKLGIGHGDAVSIALVNSYEFIVCAIGCMFHTIVCIPCISCKTLIQVDSLPCSRIPKSYRCTTESGIQTG